MSAEAYNFADELLALSSEKTAIASMSEAALVDLVVRDNAEIFRSAEACRDIFHYSVIRALHSGYALQRLKKERADERDWGRFIEATFPSISRATLYRHLGLAKRFPQPTLVPKNLSLSAAYRLALPSLENKETTPGTSRASSGKVIVRDFSRRMALLTKAGEAVGVGSALTAMTPEKQGKIAAEIRNVIVTLEKVLTSVSPTSSPVVYSEFLGKFISLPVPPVARVPQATS